MEQQTCQRNIQMTNFIGKAGKRKCGKVATHKEDNGLPICEHHYNKLMKKIEGIKERAKNRTYNTIQ